SQIRYDVPGAASQKIARCDILLNRILPEFQSLDGPRRSERASLSVFGGNVAASLPHKRVPSKCLVISRRGFEQTAKTIPFGQFARELQELIPCLWDIGF